MFKNNNKPVKGLTVVLDLCKFKVVAIGGKLLPKYRKQEDDSGRKEVTR